MADLEPRTRRALTECMTVLDAPEPATYHVVSQSGKQYTVDPLGPSCTCPDHEYRDVECKHIRRVAFATGARPVPDGLDGVDPLLGRHVPARNAPSETPAD